MPMECCVQLPVVDLVLVDDVPGWLLDVHLGGGTLSGLRAGTDVYMCCGSCRTAVLHFLAKSGLLLCCCNARALVLVGQMWCRVTLGGFDELREMYVVSVYVPHMLEKACAA